MDKEPQANHVLEVENTSSIDKIPDHLWPAINQVKELYHDVFGESLKSIYLEGSAARGDYVEGLSDVDIHVIVDRQRTDQDRERLRVGKDRIKEQTGIHNIDLGSYELDQLLQNPRPQFMLAKDGVLLDGEPFVPNATFPPIGIELARFLDAPIAKRIQSAHLKLVDPQKVDDAGLDGWSRWIAKQVLRLALGVAMARQPVYTASMQEMPDLVKQVVPELSEAVDRLNQAYLKPTSDQADYEEILVAVDHIKQAAEKAGVIDASLEEPKTD